MSDAPPALGDLNDSDSNLRLHEQGEDMLILRGDERFDVAHFQLGNHKTSARKHEVAAVVLHYTAIKASRRPASDLERFEQVLEPDGVETVSALVDRIGHIPSGLSLSLQNARSKREASWDFLIGDEGLIVQGNLRPTKRLTWHAGRRRARYLDKDKNVFYVDPYTHDRHLVWDHANKKFRYPVYPDGSVPSSGNARTIGIEIENYGRLYRRKGRYCRRSWIKDEGKYKYTAVELGDEQVVKVGTQLYERISDATLRSLFAVMVALRDQFALPETAWFGHQQITPDQRADPQPPLNIADLVEQLYEPDDAEMLIMDEVDLDGEFGPDGDDDYDYCDSDGD